jgi:hypothetical protein
MMRTVTTAESIEEQEQINNAQIAAALQAGNIGELADLLSTRNALAELRKYRAYQDKQAEGTQLAQWEQQMRAANEQAIDRRQSEGNRQMAIHSARQLQREWNFDLPPADTPQNRISGFSEDWTEAKGKYDRLIVDNNIQPWELQG